MTEQHPEGTGEVLRQLRAEREALTLQVEEQRRLLEQARYTLKRLDNLYRFEEFVPEFGFDDGWRPGTHLAWESLNAITQHLKGKA